MSAKRRRFNCHKCGKSSEKTVPNFYKQLKIYGCSYCTDCAIKIRNSNNSKREKERNKSKIKNKDLVGAICEKCGQTRSIQYRLAKQSKLCYSCAAKESHRSHRDSYLIGQDKLKNNNNFKKLVSNGIMAASTPEQRSENARKSAEYWNNPEIKECILKRRMEPEYRKTMREIWDRPGYRKAASKRAKEHFKKLWQNEEFRNKMAIARSKMPRESSQQKILSNILDDLNIEHFKEYPIGPWCFDSFIPEHNLLIEVQGEYWHSLPKAIRNDRSKRTYITNYTDYDVLYLYERDFYSNNTVLNKLLSKFGISSVDEKKFDFSNVSIKVEENKTISEFLYSYHYLGTITHSNNICFYLNDELIAVGCIGPCSRNETPKRHGLTNNECRELRRFCIKPGYHKKNFASWCLSRIRSEHKESRPKTKRIYSFADSTMGHNGTIYKADNWIYDGDTQPSYYYISNNGWVMHKKSLYNMAIKMGLKEKEYAELHGYAKQHTDNKSRFYKDI